MSRSPISDYSKAIMTMALNPDAAWVSDDSSPQPLGSQSQPFKPQDYTAIRLIYNSRLCAFFDLALFALRSRVWRSFLQGDDDTSTLAYLDATRLCGSEVRRTISWVGGLKTS